MVLDYLLAIPVVANFDYPNSPLVRFEPSFLFAGKLTGMATRAPFVIYVKAVFTQFLFLPSLHKVPQFRSQPHIPCKEVICIHRLRNPSLRIYQESID